MWPKSLPVFQRRWMGCAASQGRETTVRQFSPQHSTASSSAGEEVEEEMTEERRMISSQLGEGDDWLAREREKLKRLHALPPIQPRAT